MVRVRYSFGSRHTGHIANIAKQRAKYPAVMKDVIAISDIILEILDARYVRETRNREIEKELIKEGKRIIYVLNKSDLIDIKKADIPKDLEDYVFLSATTKKGAKELRTKIMIEAKRILKLGKVKRVHVGIIGYPNVGKSSVINLIVRRGAAKTSIQAGFTKGIQKIRMNEMVLILDTPGVIPESKYSCDSKIRLSEDAKVGARSFSDVREPEGIVDYLMKTNSEAIERFYGFSVNGNGEELVEMIGKKKGFLGKGGVVDVDRTARLILRDWQSGLITKK